MLRRLRSSVSVAGVGSISTHVAFSVSSLRFCATGSDDKTKSPSAAPPAAPGGANSKAVATGAAGTGGKAVAGGGKAPKQYWFSNIERRLTPADSAMAEVEEILKNPTDPQGHAPANLAPIPQIGTPPAGLVVEGPHEVANPPFQPAPLMLVEEVIKPLRLLSEMELLMKAWSEEFARAYFIFTVTLRFLIACVTCFLLYFYYRTVVRIERLRRGGDNMPKNLRIGSIVYFDLEEDGRPMGRVVIGLLNDNCPLYCEYFHRRCTGNGGDGNTFRGMRIKCMNPTMGIVFGDGKNMTHDVPGYNPKYLPTEWLAPGPWRGCLMSIPYAANQESPNFAVLLNSGDFTPNVFAMVLGGFEVIERMAAGGIVHACEPRHEYVVEGCGELCTLDKSSVQPLPWRLYESISRGYDAEKFGEKANYKQLLRGLMGEDAPQQRRSWLLF
jgi:hypothetical protein